MTKKINLIIALFAIGNFAFGQSNRFEIKVKATDKTFTGQFTDNKADFSKKITLSFTGDAAPSDLTVTSDQTKTPDKTNNDFSFDVKDPKSSRITLKIKADGYTVPEFIIENNTSDGNPTGNGSGNSAYNYFYKTFANFKDINKRYDRKENKAIYYFNERGMLLGPAPVNVDADDYLVIYMAVPKNQSELFSIQVDGDYNASDLLIRPYEAINPIGDAQGTGSEEVEYTYITQTFGPFTSDKATIKFFNGENELTNHLDVRINKLYNVAIGASFISTNLEKPSFDIFPIAGTTNNTINTINNGSRTLATFNVIYYWKPTIDWATGKLKGKSNITRGRDILKEATFWERLNPTFGVAINSEWRENFFFGGNFEFARGGSISAGWHYGKVQKLADSNFKLGTDVYTGTKEEIKLTNTWQTGFFFGITLDTRIFNKILSRN
jgi:hypothetical protein